MEKLHLTYVFLIETVAAIIMFYKNRKVNVCSLDGNTDFFYIVTGILQGDTLTAIIMFYKNTKVNVRSTDGNTDFFYSIAGVLQGDICS